MRVGRGGVWGGFGAGLGGGWTGGHGVGGVAGVSKRSLSAVAVFILTAGLTVFLIRHALWGG